MASNQEDGRVLTRKKTAWRKERAEMTRMLDWCLTGEGPTGEGNAARDSDLPRFCLHCNDVILVRLNWPFRVVACVHLHLHAQCVKPFLNAHNNSCPSCKLAYSAAEQDYLYRHYQLIQFNQ